MARSLSPVRCINTAQHTVSPMSWVGQGLWWLITTFAGMLMNLVFGEISPIREFPKLDQCEIRRMSTSSDCLKRYLYTCVACADQNLTSNHTGDTLYAVLCNKTHIILSDGEFYAIPKSYQQLILIISGLE